MIENVRKCRKMLENAAKMLANVRTKMLIKSSKISGNDRKYIQCYRENQMNV
jgi:hypothetical protein